MKKLSSDWLLSISLLLIVSSFFFLSKIQLRGAERATEELFEEEVIVQITGAVHKPGEYRTFLGAPLELVMKRARPRMHADFSKISLNQPVVASMNVVVEEFKEIEIQVVGEGVEPAFLKVAAGTKVNELRSKIVLKKGANRSIFRKKRQLKNGEIIQVPKKTVEQNLAHCL